MMMILASTTELVDLMVFVVMAGKMGVLSKGEGNIVNKRKKYIKFIRFYMSSTVKFIVKKQMRRLNNFTS